MILALDLGTKTGVCVMTKDGGIVWSGCWNMTPNQADRWGRRFLRFQTLLANHIHVHRPTVIAYENVCRHTATDAAHIYGGLLAVLEMTAMSWEIPTEPLAVAVIKRTATGRGNADKTAMAVRASRKWPNIDILDDNQADALWIAEACRTGAKPAAKKPKKKKGAPT
jgi:Holliday junction resolvasome RuvABC endonuclease subunit